MRRCVPSLETLVQRLGPHPAARLGLAPSRDAEQLWGWLVAVCLLSDRLDVGRSARALQELGEAGRSPAAAAAAPAGRLAEALERAGHPRAERRGAQLVRIAACLVERHAGSLERLADGADDLEALGGSLVALGPGLGAASALRFLAPLRARFPAAGELPLPPAAHAAGVHLGLLDASEAELAGGDALARALERAGPGGGAGLAPDDLEWALGALGARACLRGRADRCPLEAGCPLNPRSGPRD